MDLESFYELQLGRDSLRFYAKAFGSHSFLFNTSHLMGRMGNDFLLAGLDAGQAGRLQERLAGINPMGEVLQRALAELGRQGLDSLTCFSTGEMFDFLCRENRDFRGYFSEVGKGWEGTYPREKKLGAFVQITALLALQTTVEKCLREGVLEPTYYRSYPMREVPGVDLHSNVFEAGRLSLYFNALKAPEGVHARRQEISRSVLAQLMLSCPSARKACQLQERVRKSWPDIGRVREAVCGLPEPLRNNKTGSEDIFAWMCKSRPQMTAELFGFGATDYPMACRRFQEHFAFCQVLEALELYIAIRRRRLPKQTDAGSPGRN